MDHTFVDANSMKSLEDYAIFLISGILSLKTLHNLQVRAIEIGILKEDMAERANTALWDLRRLMQIYQEQVNTVLELLPEDFNGQAIIAKLQETEMKKARSMTRKKRDST